jgi:prophage antirepressor-like protein
MNFFLDIFNQLLKINEKQIFIIFDNNGNIWLKFKDVLKVLGYKNVKDVIYNNTLDKHYKLKFYKIKVYRPISTPLNFQKNSLFINESGLYKILLTSQKTIAKEFLEKFTLEIMPEIRKTGKYIIKDNDKKELNKLNTKINNYKQELLYYYDKYDFTPSKNGYFYINEDTVIKNGKKTICYKIGYCKNMKKRMQNYKTGNFNYKPIAYLTLDFFNGKDIEDCVKSMYKQHIIKLKTDTICYVSLTKLKNKIIECIQEINTHICHCMVCKKNTNLEILILINVIIKVNLLIYKKL